MIPQNSLGRARRLVYAATLLASVAAQARAETPPASSYVGYVLGLHAFDVTFGIASLPGGYHVTASFRLAGVLGALWPAEATTAADGRFANGRAIPRQMVSQGRYWGTDHLLRVDWKDGLPVVVRQSPPADKNRQPVPLRDQVNTVDALSAFEAIMQQVASQGRCDMVARTYDGSRLSELTARTIGHETLKPAGRSTFHGDALRCELSGRMIAGFLRGDDSAASRRPKLATVWFAKLRPDAPPMPVRMSFAQQGSPGAVAYLVP